MVITPDEEDFNTVYYAEWNGIKKFVTKLEKEHKILKVFEEVQTKTIDIMNKNV